MTEPPQPPSSAADRAWEDFRACVEALAHELRQLTSASVIDDARTVARRVEDGLRVMLDAAEQVLAQARDGAQSHQKAATLAVERQQLIRERNARSAALAEHEMLLRSAAEVSLEIVGELRSASQLLDNEVNGLGSKLLRSGRFFAYELKSMRIRRIATFLRRCVAYARGQRNAFAPYTSLDPVPNVIGRLAGSVNKLRHSRLLAGAEGDAKAVTPACFTNRGERRQRRVGGTNSVGKRIAYFTNQLLDWHDRRPRYGGGERYCLELTRLLQSLGFEVDIYQTAYKAFEGSYHGNRVRAIPMGETRAEFVLGAAERFYEVSLDYDFVLYNLPDYCAGRVRLDALSICHGLWFDHSYQYSGYEVRGAEWYRHLRKGFANPKCTVSVDTSSINFVRALWPEIAGKMVYIPNFVDLGRFRPPDEPRRNAPLVVLIPRRGHPNRGSRALPGILRRIRHDVVVHWVGEGDAEDTALIKDLAGRDPRLRYSSASFDEMPRWYQVADIAVIPTMAAEGTSLSCIEALASGCATVATTVGGLPDLVQDGVNGRLVAPTAQAIGDAINDLIENGAERRRLQAAAVESSRQFSLDKWRTRWTSVLEDQGWLRRSEVSEAAPVPRSPLAIVTRNAYHGGVESMIANEARLLQADVIVAGGLDDPDGTCPFPYDYVDTYEALRVRLAQHEVVVYHWPPDWAVRAIGDSGLPSVEVVHRTDTNECDKSVPTFVATTADDVAASLAHAGVASERLQAVVDLERFRPRPAVAAEAVGAVTSYTHIKGVDVLIRAWALVHARLQAPPLRLWGAGPALAELQRLAQELGAPVDFHPALSDPAAGLAQLRLYVSAARHEGLPLAILEALAMNVPVVHSDIPSARAVNRAAQDHGFAPPLQLFPTEDPQALASAIEAAWHEPSLASRSFVVARFDPHRHAAELEAIVAKARARGQQPAILWDPIEEIEDSGEVAPKAKATGFARHVVSDDGRTSGRYGGDVGDLVATNQSYVVYYLPIDDEVDRVSCLVTCGPAAASNWIQFDWVDRDGQSVASTGWSRTTRQIYATQAVPATRDAIVGLLIAIRPDAEQSATVRHIRLCTWQRRAVSTAPAAV